jgi:periplasmic divalent cation tolerance protein
MSDSATDAVLVLTTMPAEADCAALARTLVAERLAACVSAFPPMESVYRWKDAIETDRERQLVVKTREPLVRRLLARLQSLHPYEVPELLVIPVAGGSEAYLDWLAAATPAVPGDNQSPR